VLSVVSSGIAQYVAWVFIDGDLVTHDEAERAIEADLAAIYSRLGQPISTSDAAPPKSGHNVVGGSSQRSRHSASTRSGGCVTS